MMLVKIAVSLLAVIGGFFFYVYAFQAARTISPDQGAGYALLGTLGMLVGFLYLGFTLFAQT